MKHSIVSLAISDSARALKVPETLNATVADMRFVKPIDEHLIAELASSHTLLVTLEENAVMGGAGAAVSEFLAAVNIVIPMLQLGLPDSYIDHGKHEAMLKHCGLDEAGIGKAIQTRLEKLQVKPLKTSSTLLT